MLFRSDLVILSSDGINERMDLASYEAALLADPQRLAERILKDWGHEADDAAVLILRNCAESS